MIVSVVMTAYNEKISIINEAISSILKQTFQNFELIIVLDNPKNQELITYLKKIQIQDKRVRLIINAKNLGQAQSANIGIRNAVGKYIARMDADDISKQQRLDRSLYFIEKNGADMIFTEFDFIDENGIFLKKSLTVPESFQLVKKILAFKNIITQSTVMFKKEILDEIGYYTSLKASEDYELWTRIAINNFKIMGLKESLVQYRVRANSVTTSDYFKTYVSDRFIKKTLIFNNNIDVDEFNKKIDLFNKNYDKIKDSKKQKYNRFAFKYFTLINNWDKASMKYIKLMQYMFCEPKLIVIFFNTVISNILRKRDE